MEDKYIYSDKKLEQAITELKAAAFSATSLVNAGVSKLKNEVQARIEQGQDVDANQNDLVVIGQCYTLLEEFTNSISVSEQILQQYDTIYSGNKVNTVVNEVSNEEVKAEAAPVVEVPTEEVKAEATPVVEVPVEEVKVEAAPVVETPTEEVKVEATPVVETPTEEVKVEAAPVVEVPTEEVKVEAAPVVEVPTEEVKVEAAPVVETPTEEVKVEAAPVVEAPTEEVKVEAAPVVEVPAEEVKTEAVPSVQPLEKPSAKALTTGKNTQFVKLMASKEDAKKKLALVESIADPTLTANSVTIELPKPEEVKEEANNDFTSMMNEFMELSKKENKGGVTETIDKELNDNKQLVKAVANS